MPRAVHSLGGNLKQNSGSPLKPNRDQCLSPFHVGSFRRTQDVDQQQSVLQGASAGLDTMRFALYSDALAYLPAASPLNIDFCSSTILRVIQGRNITSLFTLPALL